jgi:hypothetical protein
MHDDEDEDEDEDEDDDDDDVVVVDDDDDDDDDDPSCRFGSVLVASNVGCTGSGCVTGGRIVSAKWREN